MLLWLVAFVKGYQASTTLFETYGLFPLVLAVGIGSAFAFALAQ